MNRMTQAISTIALAVAAVCAAHAASVPATVGTAAGAPYATAAMSSFTTTGSDMDGMKVMVTFANGSTDTATWGTTGVGNGAAAGTGWSLSLSGNTFSSAWQLTNSNSPFAIVSFSIDAAASGNTSFDIVNGAEDTPGSGNGNPFSAVIGPAGITGASATYANQLFVGGTFYGDEYELLTVTLAGTGLSGGNQTLSFIADTDNSAQRVAVTPVPEPQTYALMLAGLGVGAYLTRRRRG